MKVKFYLTGLVMWMTAFTALYAQPCDCVTTGNCPVPIEDNGTFQGYLDVTVSGPNDLSQCPLTSVCFSITHTWVGDLAVTLTSPGGANYIIMGDSNNQNGCGTQEDNIDVCIVAGTGNALTNNTEYLCNSGPCPSGTCCLTGQWTMPCGGVIDPITSAQQAPNCDLNDFNTPGSPANGTWTLTVNDVCSQDVGTLDNFSLTFACGTSSCTVCEADAGDLTEPDIQGCQGDASLNLNLVPQYSDAPPDPSMYGYAYVISQNLFITNIVASSNMAAYPPGQYSICGISYLLTAFGDLNSLVGMNLNAAKSLLESNVAPFCADISDNCVLVTIGPAIPPTVLDTVVCVGTCITVCGETVCQSGTVTCQSYLGCDSLVNVVMIPIPPVVTNASVTICEGECLEVNGNLYCPPGPHVINYTSSDGCDSTVNLSMMPVMTEAIINPSPPPAITCTNPTVVLDGLLSIPANAQFQWVGPGFNSVQPVVTVNTPGTYTLTITNTAMNPPCVSTASVVVTGSLSNPDIQVNPPLPVVCEGGIFDLSTLSIVDLNNTNPTITFHSGAPATSSNQLPSPVVTPADTTTYYILATSGNCQDLDSVEVAVLSNILADFTVDSPVCVDGESTVTYTGDDIPGATYTWNFGGGTAVPGTGIGPHLVSWATGGTKTITLIVQGNGCTSDPASQTIEVNSFITAPVINCYPTLGSIEYVWNTIPGATGYNVNVAIGPAGSSTSDTSYVVTGLNPGDQSSIFVEAVSGNACGNVGSQITCIAQDCPSVSVTIDPVDDICLDGMAAPVTLIASASGGAGGGTYTWTGPGVNPVTGVFNPADANLGANTISVTYEEGTCLYNASTVIVVNPQPSADFTADSPICLTGNSTVNYTGNASSSAVFNWDFDGGSANPTTGPGPISVNWPAAGQYDINLVVEENGCASEPNSVSVQVVDELPPPVINCNSDLNSIEFYWNSIPGADSYDVAVLVGPDGTFTSDTSYLINGLTAGDAVTIEVTAIGAGPCGNSSATANCIADDCPPVTFSIEPVADICLSVASVAFNLNPIVAGGSNGTITWSGTGIIDTLTGTFDPHAANPGANSITAVYVENGCPFTATLAINVFETPEASFTMPSPVCENETTTITYTGTNAVGLQLGWDFGVGAATPGTGNGPHTISWPTGGVYPVALVVNSAQGCVSDTFVLDATVSTPLTEPIITCDQSTSAVEFSWTTVANATAYDVTVNTGQAGQVNGNSFLVDNLNPGDEVTIELTVTGDGICPDVVLEASCIAMDCPDVVIDIEPVDPICTGNAVPVNLTATVSGGTIGTGIWSGNGITDPSNGVFDPSLVAAGQHVITFSYDEGNCHFEAYTTIEVNETPSADFITTENICITDAAPITFTGNAAPGATFTWDFGGGNALPGTGVGPHQVTWDSPGAYSISLVVEQNGCTATQVMQQVQVDPALEAPVIVCNSNTESVQFEWNDVPGAAGYQVQVLAGPAGTLANTTYSINSLLPGDEVTIQVTVEGNTICPLPVVEATCSATDCPDVEIALTAVDPICLVAQTATITLEAQVSNGSVIGYWSGNGVSGADSFNPAIAGIGTHTVTFTYNEAPNCVFVETLDIEIVAPPVADAGTGATLTCMENELDAELGGSGTSTGTNIAYDWDASSGAFPGDSTSLHPVVSLPGTYTLTVTNTALGCSDSDQVTIEASQELPQIEFTLVPISCFGENDGSIAITGITGGVPPYLYSFDGSTYSSHANFTNLEPGIYTLSVLDANGCQNTSQVDMQQPQEVDVELVAYLDGENIIRLGESVEMEAITTPDSASLDLLHWEPAALVNCDTCIRVVSSPIEATTFTVTIESNGCSDSDAMTIFIKKDRPIYVPNAFSPNGDGQNDMFFINAGGNIVKQIKSFLVFDRWGETVFQYYNFPPNEPAYGWDGTLKGKVMNPAVFTWFAEVEFIDEVTEILEGDVILVK